MLKRAVAACFAVALLSGATALAAAPDSGRPAPDGPSELSPAADCAPGQSPAIVTGERLSYSVRYGVVKAGTAVLEITGVQKIDGHPVYHLVSTAMSNQVFDQIYPVRDRVVSLMDVDSLYSRYFEKHLREGGYKADQSILFDQDHGVAVYNDGRKVPIERGTFDVLSAFYRVRTMPLRVGEQLSLVSHADRKNYDIRVSVLGREKVDTPAGTFQCVVVEPTLRSGAFFKNEGKLTIWLTDDERRIPVLMKSKIPVGSISVVLTDLRRPSETTSAQGSERR